jgi:Do/DeqQ family serine protease
MVVVGKMIGFLVKVLTVNGRPVLGTVLSIQLLLTVLSADAALPLKVDSEPMPSLAPMLEKVTPAVVGISTTSRVTVRENPLFRDPFFRRFFDLPDSQPQERRSQSLGSGVIVDAKNGYVLTNHHVVKDADEISITLQKGKEHKAKVIGTDSESDIAVIQIDADDLTEIKFSDSDALRVGDFVVAIGNPFGLRQTVTSGIVSALGRSGLGIESYENFIQTDASINVGNSGGALVNLRGELVGINTAIFAPSGGNVGIGFAIPANMARNLMEQIITHGEVRRGRLGVYIQDLSSELAEAFGVKDKVGAVIAQVIPGSSAEKAGVEVEDVIIRVNEKPIKNAADLRNAVGLLQIGEKVQLRLIRDGKKMVINAVIGAPDTVQNTGQQVSSRLDGAVLGNLDKDDQKYRGATGVVVLEVRQGSPAWGAGLREDDIIVSVNRQRVESLAEFQVAIGASSGPLLLNIQRGDGALFLVIR